MGQVVSLEAAEEQATRVREQGGVVVFTNGCFDLLHVGHLACLRAAKQAGHLLVVGVNSDASVRSLKGANRPIVPQAERAELVAGLEPVDLVVIFSEPTPEQVLRAVRPQVVVKGADYARPEDLPEYGVLRELGVRVMLVPLVNDRSTSALLERLAGGEVP